MNRLQFLLPVLLAALSGCAEFDLKKNIPWGAGEDGKLGRPMKLVANWSETVMTSGSSPPIRGFGGRLVFYASEGGKPIKVAGTLTVYAFDETSGIKDDVVPDRKFVFTEEQFALHHSDKGMLKHSYNFWLPFDELGGEKKEISLLCRFVSSQGDVVLSEQTRHLLPGKPPKQPALPESLAQDVATLQPTAPTATSQGVQQVGYFEPIPPSTETRARMETTTINLSGDSAMRAGASNASGTGDAGSAAGTTFDLPGVAPLGGVTPRRLPAVLEATPPQPSAHFGPDRYRALRASTSPPERDRGLWQRPRGGWQSGSAAPRSTAPASASGPAPAA